MTKPPAQRRGRNPRLDAAVAFWIVATTALASCQDPGEPAGAPAEKAAEPTDDPTKTPSDFVRFVADGETGRLDTAITTYRKGDVELVLYGAIHIADQSHYDLLQQRFAAHDALLYEMVAPEDHRPRQGEPRSGLLSQFQNALKSALELQFQLDGVDYSPRNFVHADMTPREFADSMEERGETILSLMFSMMQNAPAMQDAMADLELPASVETDLVEAFRTGQGRHSMRMVFASQLEKLELMSAGGEGSTLLEGRNEKCLEVLQREIAAGKKKIGIYYGAAHYPHMEARLVDDLGFRKTNHEWITAWLCRPPAPFDAASDRKAKRALIHIGRAVKAWWDRGGDRAPELAELAQGESPLYDGSLEDPWGQRFRIEGDGRSLTIRSAGPDGEDGTQDDLERTVTR